MSEAQLRLGLGTVQFGLDYGITNEKGRVPEDEVRGILALCTAEGIDTLDTAHLYGGSEAAIGRNAPLRADFRIVTKTPTFGAAASADEAARQLREAFQGSLAKLRRRSVYGLLFHDVDDLLNPLGSALWAECERLREERLLEKIGLSVYYGEDIDRALGRYSIDLVQLPYNPLDHRLVEGGQLSRLARAGVEVHGRSLFLQGLLLQELARIPLRFGPLRDAIAELDDYCRAAGLTRLEGVLALAFERREISRFICGVTTVGELRQIISAAKRVSSLAQPMTFARSAPLDDRLLNPALWSKLDN